MHLAQLNISRLLAPIDSPLLADFVAQLDTINKLGENSPGFVWRLKDDNNNATQINPFEDPMIIINLTVWESVEDLMNFAYRSGHSEVLKQRRKWFDPTLKLPSLVLWWIPRGHRPSPNEAKDRLLHLHQHGPSEVAFQFRKIFPQPFK
jgi:Domain of unknown function (DUF3291)